MDEIAAQHGAAGPWPSFAELDLAAVARGFGCSAETIATYDDLVRALDEVLPGLRGRRTPLLLDVRVSAGA
jgi:benzoylformate decarboxylase